MLQKCYDRVNTTVGTEKQEKEDLKSPKKKSLPPIKGSKTESERLNSKWNGKYDREINQKIETLEVKTEKVAKKRHS